MVLLRDGASELSEVITKLMLKDVKNEKLQEFFLFIRKEKKKPRKLPPYK
jgi:hypothetical protein